PGVLRLAAPTWSRQGRRPCLPALCRMSRRHEMAGGSVRTHVSGYQFMWMLVTFDLPVETKAQRKAAGKFRLALLDLGFEMSQLSNYLRFCNGKEQFEAYIRKIEANLPAMGDVYIFQF